MNAAIIRNVLLAAALCLVVSARVFAQNPSSDAAPAGESCEAQQCAARDDSSPRIFGIIPNYRTSPTLTNYAPLSPATKFHLAAEDSFDRGTFILAGLFAAQSQWTQAAPSFGHGVGAYGRYYSAALADLVVGDFMTEAVYPRVLHQDPRYFRRGKGSGWRRLGYAVGQIAWTHTDTGAGWFNASEILGNATAVAIGNAYYPDGRTFSRTASRWSWQVGTDAAANILKEFWPDLDRKFGHHAIQTPVVR
jgi:hypothetical protein